MDKPTDSEIVKALEHIEAFTCCENCAFYKKCKGKCVITATLALINRLQAENERLQKNLEEAHLDIKEQRAGIESLEAENKLLIDRNCELAEKGERAITTFVKSQNQIKAEAYKEFAERLCEDRVSNDNTVILAKCLLKELVGEDNES